MTRNLKALLAAALALAAFSAVSASAQAAEFHCSVTNCRGTVKPDGTGKTAHQVFVLENSTTTEQVSFTCSEIKAEATAAATTSTEITAENISYPSAGCTINGSSGVEFVMNGCKFKFANTGTITITGCNAGKSIEFRVTGGCIFSIAEQGPLEGVKYHTIGTTPNREVTVELNVHGIVVTRNASCEAFIKAANPLIGTYTTGNAIVTGETQAGVMADAWYE